MNRTEKTAQIATVKGNFDRAISVALVNFQGLKVDAVTALRKEFRKANVEYRVFKNTVIRHALKDGPYAKLVGDLKTDRKNGARADVVLRGMTGVAWSYGDPAAAAKVIEKFKKDFGPKAEKLQIKTGLVSGDMIAGDKLAKMPGLKETQAQIVGLMVAPAAQLYAALITPGAMIAAILEAHVAKQTAEGKE